MEKSQNLINIIPQELMDSCQPFSFEIERLMVGGESVFAELVTTLEEKNFLIIYTHLPKNSTVRDDTCFKAYNEFSKLKNSHVKEVIVYFYSEEYKAFTKYDTQTDQVVKIFTIQKFLKHIGIYAEK